MRQRVIVRRELPNNNIILFFPDQKWTSELITCFSWIEGHSGASLQYMREPYTYEATIEDQEAHVNRYVSQYCSAEEENRYCLVLQR